jgi:hypothetical protein
MTMDWTTEQKVKSLMRLPWTVMSEKADDPDEFIVRVKELPGTVVVGTKDEIDEEFWDALRTGIEARLQFDDGFELPPGVRCLPWKAEAPKWPRRILVKQKDAEPDSLTASSESVEFAP